MTWHEIDALAAGLYNHEWSMTLAITAAWVEKDGKATPFPHKFPGLASVIRFWLKRGLFDIACHGLTHCLPGAHVPSWKLWRSNRAAHREFIDALPLARQKDHLHRARCILEHTFMVPVTTLVPPGNAISEAMSEWALTHGYTRIVCRSQGRAYITDDSTHRVLHDRELVQRGVDRVLDDLALSETIRAYQRLSAVMA